MGSDSVADDSPSALPQGTRLGELEVQRVLGVGGFGIVYLAFDHDLEREVAVKEYMPQSLAGRTATLHVSLRSGSHADTFALGLRSFVNEARLLARFDHPSLLKVHRFWEANGTAYMAMPVYRGPTLKQVRSAMDHPPTEAWLRGLLEPMLGALGVLHEAGVFHRDIAPDNIVLEGEGRPVLLDFGAARRVISDKTQTLTAILKPAYAPIEQYAEGTLVKQGPWTDFYALGATLHYLLTGRPPLPATARALHDEQPALAGQAVGDVSTGFLEIVDWMLSPHPADRPQSVAELQAVLAGRARPPVPERTVVLPRPPVTGGDDGYARTVAVQRTAVPAPAPSPPAAPVPPTVAVAPARKAAASPAPVPTPTPTPSRVPLLAGGAVAVAALVGWLAWPRGGAGVDAPAPPVSAPVVMAQPASAPVAAAAPGSAMPLPPLPDERAADAGKPAVLVAAPVPSTPPSAAPATSPPPRSVAAASRPVPRPALPPAVVTERLPATAPAAEHRPAPASPAPAGPTPVSAAAPPPAPAPAAAGPQCGKRMLVALSLCMERECARPELHQHADCVKWRADLERLRNPQQ